MTLFHKAKRLVTEEEVKTKEVEYIILKITDCKPWMFNANEM